MQEVLSKQSIEKFQIGYALNSWDFDYKFLTSKQFHPKLMEKAGLIIKREQDGSILIAFVIELCFLLLIEIMEKQLLFQEESLGLKQPKYLNSPETAIFNKSKVLYNYSLSKTNDSKASTGSFI